MFEPDILLQILPPENSRLFHRRGQITNLRNRDSVRQVFLSPLGPFKVSVEFQNRHGERNVLGSTGKSGAQKNQNAIYFGEADFVVHLTSISFFLPYSFTPY